MAIREENKRLEEVDRRYVWHPFTQMKEWANEKPVIIVEGRDCFLKDINGRWYLDGVSSLWVNVHGHRKAELDDAIRAQIEMVAHSTLLGLANVPSINFAEKLVSRIHASLGEGLNKVFYSDDGSTAVEAALKMAFQYWKHKGVEGKEGFISLDNAYHGDTLGAMSVGGVGLFHGAFSPLFFKTHRAPSPYCYRCKLTSQGPEQCGFLCLKEMEKLLNERMGKIAAVIVEPLVQAAGGMIVHPPGYLKGVRDLCTEYNVLMIADEVATGFGRTGRMLACEHEGVLPDILCLSKGITGGYLPLAVTVTTEKVYNAFLGEYAEFKTFFHGHSYTGNPLACACAIASLELFEKEKTIENLQPKVKLLGDWLGGLLANANVGDVRQSGLMAGIELVKDKVTKELHRPEEKIGWRVAYAARDNGVLIRPLGNIVVIMPPLSISMENLAQMLSVIEDAINSATEVDRLVSALEPEQAAAETTSASKLQTGYNDNIRFEDVLYHVQTEDLGSDKAQIRTLVYKEGRIVMSKVSPYDEIKAGGPVSAKVLYQHQAIIKGIKAGKLKSRA